jgi:hypothetical protein
MVNPYTAAASRVNPKSQIQLGQSQLLKKIEKLTSKHGTGSSLDHSKSKKSNRFTLDSSKDSNDDDEDDDDEEDEDSVFKNLKKSTNKFMKKKETAAEPKKPSPRGTKSPRSPKEVKRSTFKAAPDSDVSDDSELEISANDRSSTPKNSKFQSYLKSRLLSTASSIHDHAPQPAARHRRSPSKVKFSDNQNLSDEDESTIIEEMLSKNLVLDINELEASISATQNAPNRRKSGEGGGGNMRSDSVASVIEENEDRTSSNESSSESVANHRTTNLILSIDDLDRSFDNGKKSGKISASQKKTTYETKKSPRNKDAKQRGGSAKKSPKRVKTPTSVIDTESEMNPGNASIQTEIETEVNRTDNEVHTDDIRTVRSQLTDKSSTANENRKQRGAARSYRDDFETSLDTTELSLSNKKSARKSKKQHEFLYSSDRKDEKKERKKSKKSKKDKKHRRSFSASSVSSEVSKSSRKATRKSNRQTTDRMTISNAEIQVDPTDMLKHTDLYKSVGSFNPSSLMIASLSYLNDETNLNDLNQLTGYNLINQSYNDLIRMNLSFFRNFLTVQRSLYQQQIASIKPK